jgi:hypothetical protein
MSAWTWIRKNIFRIYRGGKHRTDGLSTAEKAVFRKPEQESRDYAIRSPLAYVPVVPGRPQEVTEVARAAKISTSAPEREDYVPRHVSLDETTISADDWTQ